MSKSLLAISICIFCNYQLDFFFGKWTSNKNLKFLTNKIVSESEENVCVYDGVHAQSIISGFARQKKMLNDVTKNSLFSEMLSLFFVILFLFSLTNTKFSRNFNRDAERKWLPESLLWAKKKKGKFLAI